jgi:hypothetical protein
MYVDDQRMIGRSTLNFVNPGNRICVCGIRAKSINSLGWQSD